MSGEEGLAHRTMSGFCDYIISLDTLRASFHQ